MASSNVTFNSIPPSTRKPGQYFEYNTTGAVNALPGNDQHMLIIGQRLETGTVAALVPTSITDDGTAAIAFGNGSIAHLMARAALQTNPYLQLTVITLDDAGTGVAAAGSVVIAGPASGTGNLILYVGKVPVVILVNNGDSASTIAANLVEQITNQPDLPVTATVDQANPDKVDITAKNKGLAGNGLVLSTLSQTNGVSATVTAMAGGLSDPDIQPALTAVFGAGHNILVGPFSTQASLTTLRAHLDTVSGPMEQRGAMGVAGWPGTLATGTTLTGQVNEGRISVAWHNGSVCPAWMIAASYGAEVASEADPAMPLNTLPLAALDVTDVTKRPGRTDQETALHNGLTPLEVGPGDVVQIVRAVSTYTTNPEGVADPSLLDITTIRSLDYVRLAIRQRMALRFPRSKGTARVVKRVRSEMLDVLFKLEELEIVQNVEANKDGIILEWDLQSVGQLNAKIPANVVPGLHVIAGVIDLIL